ncbi:hypothetical protein [Rhodohalobacter halophilus]|uniref:hypothetical protein n=1 Tax=Rhodohalobacter halophilus TaxID=1812810 RepID=UPI00083FC0A5|nr:hypothetical protein [Rhodohalobacter halophilus]
MMGSVPFLISSGLIAVLLFLVGLIYTFKEFKEMEEHPEDFRRRRPEEPKIVDSSKEDSE